MNLWADIVLHYPAIIPQLPRDITLLNWAYQADADRIKRNPEIAESGLAFVCCPGTNGWQSHGARLYQGLYNIQQFASVAHRDGAEGLLNTNWGDAGHRNPLGSSLCGMAYGASQAWQPDSKSPEQHVRHFVHSVYGPDKADMANALEVIGDNDLGTWAYHGLLEKLAEPEPLAANYSKGRAVLDDVQLTDQQVQDKLQQTQKTTFPTRSPETEQAHGETFESLAIREHALANNMNAEALRRLLLSRSIRSGKSPDQEMLKTHRSNMQALREEFRRLWLARNRESRLADNLAGFDNAIAELKEFET